MKKFTKACCVSGKDCNAPYAFKKLEGAEICDYNQGNGARLVCFACGDTVCENCSFVYDYYEYGKKVICDNCAEEHELVKPKLSTIFIKNQ